MIIIPITSWSDYKEIVLEEKDLSIQYSESTNSYELYASESGIFVWNISLIKDDGTDVNDFEDNYKSNCNKKINDTVQTQFERPDINLRVCSVQAYVGEDSTATCEIAVPTGGRYISGGDCWFDSQHKDDRITNIEVVDLDNILGYGAGTILKTYHDPSVSAENAGWRIPSKFGHIYAETLGFYGYIPAGLYLRVIGKKGGDITTGTFYLNLEWGDSD